ncbi:MAG TPA: DUF1570 domain-containing protein [Gemmataceae bacterium]|jgi:hypothetical protein
MNRWILAVAGLLGSAGFATADYVILVANLAADKELRTLTGGAAGAPGRPGMPAGGVPGGIQGAPGMGNRGMPGGVPGMGNRGMPGGIQGAGGMPGGMRGMRGGGFGMRGMAGMTAADDIDDVPYFILAVVEVKASGGGVSKQFKTKGHAQVKLTDRLGDEYEKENRTVYLVPKTSSGFGETHVLTEGNGKPLPTVHQQFDKQLDELKTKGKASTEDIFKLAEWTLSHGLIDKFPQVMDKLVESDKGHPAAVAYLKVKPDLDRLPTRDDPSLASIKKALGPKYKEVPGQHHYAVLYNSAVAASEVKSHLNQLENSFRGFYYWFALKGVALPVPDYRQIAILTGEKDFDQFHKALASGPVVVDGFFARRENLAVMSSKRLDESYDALNKYYQTWEDKGLHRGEVLLKNPKTLRAASDLTTLADAQMLALMLRALEKEAELATVSHDASRQLLFASGLLPSNVAVPEWLLFGMGSFFETPLQSPWPSLGAPNAYYLPRWKELKGKELKNPSQTLRMVITDAFFRSLPSEGKAGSAEQRSHDAVLRKARAASWSLAYYLATSDYQNSSEKRFEGLLRYFKELGKMPRDIELDDEILLGCFARAFGLVDASNKVDNAKLDRMARDWYSHMDNVQFEYEATMKKIRDVFRDKLKEMEEQAKKSSQGQVDPQTGQPIQPGTLPQQAPRPGGIPQQGPRPGGFRPQPQPQPRPPAPGRVPQGGKNRPIR